MIDLSGPIEPSEWKHTPCITGRAVTEEDVKSGLAVFCVKGESTPAQWALPCCAIQLLEDGSEQRVVVVQAETIPDATLLGVRPLAGGNGICQDDEVRLLSLGFEP